MSSFTTPFWIPKSSCLVHSTSSTHQSCSTPGPLHLQFHLPVTHSPHFLTADSLSSRSQPNRLLLGEVVPDHPVQRSCPSHHPFLMLYSVLVTPAIFCFIYLCVLSLSLTILGAPGGRGLSVMLSAMPPASSTAPGSALMLGHQDMSDCVLSAVQSSSHHPPNLPQGPVPTW